MDNKCVRISKDKYFQYVKALWVYTLIVVLWGAWVRISKSGDGCGRSWPLCHGEVLPNSMTDVSTWIEWTHRFSTGIFGLAVIVLVIMAFKIFPAGHKARKLCLWTLFFTLTEALIGAKLVLSELVGEVSSFQRAFVMSIHQINSLLLTGSLAMSFKDTPSLYKNVLLKQDKYIILKGYFLEIGFLILSVIGAVAALSSTLFPSESLIEGFWLDIQKDSHWLLQWRISHPLFAIFYISLSLFLLPSFNLKEREGVVMKAELLQQKLRVNHLMLLYILAFIVGLTNLLALSPILLKLLHLTVTHVLWAYLLYFLHISIPSLR